MRASEPEARDMFSVLSVQGVEGRMREAPAGECVTVKFAAGSGALRYDETRLRLLKRTKLVSIRRPGAKAQPSAAPTTPAQEPAAA